MSRLREDLERKLLTEKMVKFNPTIMETSLGGTQSEANLKFKKSLNETLNSTASTTISEHSFNNTTIETPEVFQPVEPDSATLTPQSHRRPSLNDSVVGADGSSMTVAVRVRPFK